MTNDEKDERVVLKAEPGTVGETMRAFLDTARADNAFGQPIEHEGQLIIPASEILVAQGFGLGYGSGPVEDEEKGESSRNGQGGGGGGGGRTLSRPVAVIVANKDHVRVEPVVDLTKLGITLLTALGALALASSKMMKQAKDME